MSSSFPSVRRFVHADGSWFADVPTVGTEWMDAEAAECVVEEDDDASSSSSPSPPTRPLPSRCVLLRGRVLASHGDRCVASCDGLIVSSPCPLPLLPGDRVRVVIS